MIKQTSIGNDMQKGMWDLQPKLQEIQEKYKDDPTCESQHWELSLTEDPTVNFNKNEDHIFLYPIQNQFCIQSIFATITARQSPQISRPRHFREDCFGAFSPVEPVAPEDWLHPKYEQMERPQAWNQRKTMILIVIEIPR